jgi:hypothetical protein
MRLAGSPQFSPARIHTGSTPDLYGLDSGPALTRPYTPGVKSCLEKVPAFNRALPEFGTAVDTGKWRWRD